MASPTSLITLASSGVSLTIDSSVSADIIARIIEKMHADCILTIRKANKMPDASIETLSKLINPLNHKRIIFDFSE